MPSDAEEEIEAEVLPLVLSLAPCEGAGCCPRLPVPWHWGPGTIAGPWTLLSLSTGPPRCDETN